MNAEVITKVRSQVDFCRQLQKSDSIVTWDTTVDRHARTAQNLTNILNQPEFSDSPEKSDLLNRLDALLSRCKDSTFQIAFVGAIKAGKSTLINAILGQNIASTRVTPETAVLTKFRHSETYYVRVKFYTASEWDALWATISKRADVFMEEYKELDGDNHKREWINHADYQRTLSAEEIKDELERWSSSKHPEHYFVKEIEVGLPTLKLPENVVFVDTPGLDDPVAYRSDVTSNYIARANAVFVCVTAHAMTGEEQKTIYGVFNNSSSNDKIFIIGTQTDNLNNPFEDWQEQCSEWVKYMKESSCYGSESVAREHILPAAAFMENLCREYAQNPDAVSEDEQNILMSLAMKYKTLKISDVAKGQSAIAQGISDLQKYTYVDAILDIVREKILTKYKTYLIEDIEKAYTMLKSDLRNYFLGIVEQNQEGLEASNSSLEEITSMLESAKAEAELHRQNKEELKEVMSIAKEYNQQRIQGLETALKELIQKD